MKIEQLHQLFLESQGICTDTRKIKKGCLFFALKGEKFDGNSFAHKAIDQGAHRAIIDDIRFHKNTGETILCKDVLKQLQKLATFHRNYLDITIIALTGSNGKTTTKELINAVLAKKYCTTATLGNLNNHIGVPLTLLSMDQNTEIGIVEMGANHKKEIEALSQIAEPNFGYITNFGKAHLEGFGGVEGVIQGKSELYTYIRKSKGVVFVNQNDPKQVKLTQHVSSYHFGKEGTDCNISLLDAQHMLLIRYEGLEIQTNLIGIYNFHNIAAAIAIGKYFNVTATDIKEALELYVPNMNRSQLLQVGTNSIILDAYNANPTSMLAALENFRQNTGDSKILILGDMFELGNDSDKEHQAIVDYLEAHNIGKVYLVGENFYATQTSAAIVKFPSYKSFATHFKKEKITSSHFLIKGSRGMALERALEII